ncbi:MAG TPA: AAA family ATPase [Tepidisphaeraceae bacterium]|nr:AAA family ATPase [Tepidisphaeraceae bacterium]
MSQEIQLVNNLPLQPAIGPQMLAPAGMAEPTPLRRVHQLLRGRYLLAAVLACIGAVCGAAAGFLLPKPSWESIGVVHVHPVIHNPGPKDDVQLLAQNYLTNVMVELHSERTIRQAMQSPAWKQVRSYPGDFVPPEDVTEFGKNLTIKPVPFAPEMIQVIYDDSRKDGKEATQVAVKSLIAAFQASWIEKEAEPLDFKIQYSQKAKTDDELAISADNKAIHELIKEVGDDQQAVLATRYNHLFILEEQLKQAKAMLANAEQDRDRKKAGLNGAQNYTEDEISRVDPQMQARLNARNEANTQYQLLLSEYGPAYPKVIECKKLLDIRKQEIAEAVTAFNNENFIETGPNGGTGIPVAKDLSKLKASVDGLTASYNQENENIRAIAARAAQIALYKEDIEAKKRDIVGRDATLESLAFEKLMGGTFSVVDEGSVPTPAADRRPVFAALGFFGGAAVPIGFLLLIGLANPRYRFSDETNAEMNGMNLLGILPDLPDRLSDPEQASIAAHCVHQIRTMLQISGSPDERRVFAITSAAPGDGKTSLTLALGLSYAACGARTLLIDCDLVGAGLTSRMNITSPAGVLEAIANRSLFEYVRSTDVADVTILPVGTAQTLHASTLSPAALRRLIDEARKQYDTILIDTGPILGSIEASLVCAAADAVVLTVARGQQRPLVEKAISRLTGIGAKLAGVVFNRAQSGDFDRSISGASSLRSAAAGNGHNGHDQPRYGTLGRAVHSHNRQSDINEG